MVDVYFRRHLIEAGGQKLEGEVGDAAEVVQRGGEEAGVGEGLGDAGGSELEGDVVLRRAKEEKFIALAIVVKSAAMFSTEVLAMSALAQTCFIRFSP